MGIHGQIPEGQDLYDWQRNINDPYVLDAIS